MTLSQLETTLTRRRRLPSTASRRSTTSDDPRPRRRAVSGGISRDVSAQPEIDGRGGIGVAAGRGAVARRGHQIDVRPRPRPPRMHDEHDGYALG